MITTIKKVKPMFNNMVVTLNKYPTDLKTTGGIIDSTRAGSVKEYQTVVAVGPMVRGIEVGDIVYLFMSNTRNVRFKTQVVADNCKREDSEYWLEQAPTDITFRLKLVAEYSGDQLNESVLIKHGFKGGRSLQTPSYKNENLMDYIKSIF